MSEISGLIGLEIALFKVEHLMAVDVPQQIKNIQKLEHLDTLCLKCFHCPELAF